MGLLRLRLGNDVAIRVSLVGHPDRMLRNISTRKSARVRRSSIMPAIGLCSYSDLRAPPGVGVLPFIDASARHSIA